MSEAYGRRAGRAPPGSAVGGARRSVVLAGAGPATLSRLAAAEQSFGDGRSFSAAEEAFELAAGSVVPGTRVGRRRLEPNASGFATLPGRLEDGDAVQDG